MSRHIFRLLPFLARDRLVACECLLFHLTSSLARWHIWVGQVKKGVEKGGMRLAALLGSVLANITRPFASLPGSSAVVRSRFHFRKNQCPSISADAGKGLRVLSTRNACQNC